MDIGKLAIQMSIKPGNFYSEAQKFANQVQAMGNGTMLLSGMLSMIPGPAGAAIQAMSGVGSALKSAAQQGIDFIGEVAGTAKKYQMEIKSANELVVALHRVGLDTETAGAAMNHMQVAIGNGSAAFEKLGLSAVELSGLDTAEQMATIGQALNAVGNESVRAALAQEIFGRAWRDIDKFLRQGGHALEDARKRMKELGLEVSAADQIAFRDFKKSVNDSKLVATALSLSIARNLLPSLAGLNRLLAQVHGAAAPLVQGIGGLLGMVGALTSGLASLNPALLSSVVALAALALALVTVKNNVIAMQAPLSGSGIIAFAVFVLAVSNALREFDSVAATVTASIGLLVLAFASLKTGMTKSGIGLALVAIGMLANEVIQARQRVESEMQRLQRAIDEGVGGARAAARARIAVDLRDAMAEFNEANDQMQSGWSHPTEQQRQHVEELFKRMAELRRQFEMSSAPQAVMANDYFDKTSAALEREAAVFGMTAGEIARYDARLHGLNATDVERLGVLADQVAAQKEAAKQFEDMQKQAKDLEDSLKSPFEKAREEVEKLQQLLEAGLIDDDKFTAGIGQIYQKLLDADHGPANGPAGLQAGSSGAVAAVNQAMIQSQSDAQDPTERLIALQQQAKDLQERQWRESVLIRQALERIGGLN
jgi:hypothetical protein